MVETMYKAENSAYPGVSHPYAHRLTMKSSTAYNDSLTLQRSLTVTNLQMSPRTVFEMERPNTNGATPRIVVINTSFRTAFQERRNPRRHVPTFPKLSSDPSVTRNNRDTSGVSCRRVVKSSHCVRSARQEQSYSARSDAKGNNTGATPTQRQTNTFMAYAKYNDLVTSAKTREKEKAAQSHITANINDLSALVPEKMPRAGDVMLSSEKQEWISDWITTTSQALNLANVIKNDDKLNPTLDVIQEH